MLFNNLIHLLNTPNPRLKKLSKLGVQEEGFITPITTKKSFILWPSYNRVQAKLPDVNARLVRHMNEASNAFDKRDFSKAAIAFEQSIALLPEEYQPEINTAKFEELSSEKHNIICDRCKIETKRELVHPYELLLSNLARLITNKRKTMVWKCLSCKHVRPLVGSQTKLIKWYQPNYFKVIPEPPSRQGLHDRIGFEAKFEKWYDIAGKEIEHQIGLYRTEYAAQQDAVMEVIPDE